jgi:hypothetical protein
MISFECHIERSINYTNQTIIVNAITRVIQVCETEFNILQ